MPTIELLVISLPPTPGTFSSLKNRTASLVTLAAPKKFVSNSFRARSSDVPSTSSAAAMPALLNTTSIRPKATFAWEKTDKISCGWVTSSLSTRSCAALYWALRLASCSGLRSGHHDFIAFLQGELDHDSTESG